MVRHELARQVGCGLNLERQDLAWEVGHGVERREKERGGAGRLVGRDMARPGLTRDGASGVARFGLV